jgi:phosphogluconate dehydratase
MNSTIEKVTRRIEDRSLDSRNEYLDQMRNTMEQNPPRKRLSCGNLAHAFAACSSDEKAEIAAQTAANLGITTAYNDMLSAHQPYKDYPDQIKAHARQKGSTAQIAGGVPAMCDGVTQGQAGMELSLFSRDVIAMATTIGLSHNMFDANLFLGICDKIVPGMLMGALEFGHLPAVFVPSGPMPSGIPNKEKAAERQKFAEGKIDTTQMLAVESASYHSPGTCTFYGTANSNQVLMELFGLQLPGSSFVAPNTALRTALTEAAVDVAIGNSFLSDTYRPLYQVLTEKSLVNAIAALLATGGSTNHALHLVAIARSAGIQLSWEDIDEISSVVPLLARIYPNGQADVNHFETAGGLPFVVRELRRGGLLNEEVVTIAEDIGAGKGLEAYEKKPQLDDSGKLTWVELPESSGDTSILASISKPFQENGGLKLLTGNLGKAVIKISAVDADHRLIEAPARVFESQDQLKQAFDAGELFTNHISVVRFQGPAANGMPELHKMTPLLGVCQDRGFKVALVTDGRMSGASGKIPAAIHLSPEALVGGLIGKIQDGDLMRLDTDAGSLELLVDQSELDSRTNSEQPKVAQNLGRALFSRFRSIVDVSEKGAATVNPLDLDS